MIVFRERYPREFVLEGSTSPPFLRPLSLSLYPFISCAVGPFGKFRENFRITNIDERGERKRRFFDLLRRYFVTAIRKDLYPEHRSVRFVSPHNSSSRQWQEEEMNYSTDNGEQLKYP